MQEVRYWLADDGTKFEEEWDCVQYERQTKLKECNNDFVFYDYHKRVIPIEEASTDRVCYILIKTPAAADYVGEWFESDSCDNPFEGCGFGNEVGLWFYGENEDYGRGDTWYRIETEIEKLQNLRNEFVTE